MSSKVISGAAAAQAATFDWGQAAPRTAAAAGASRHPGPQVRAGGEDPEARIAQLERRAAEARQEGLREGEAAGLKRALAELEPVIERLARSAAEIASLRTRFRREAEEDVVKLALAIARRILNRELHCDPEALLGLVKAALVRLDAREVHRLRLHPGDAAALDAHLRRLGLPERLELAPDPALERGSAVFETSRGRFDASVGNQLEGTARGLADRMARLA